MHTILAVGNDPYLLASRAGVLRCASPDVTVMESQAALDLLHSMQFDLVVLCHTLSAAQMTQVSIAAHKQHRGVRVLQIVQEYQSARRSKIIDADELSDPKPEILIDKVIEMLHRGTQH